MAPEGFEVLKDVEFGTTGDRPLKLDLVRPKARPAMPLPIVVWVHGGAWRAGTKSLGRVMPLVERGYAVAAITYRLTGEAQWPAQIQDCKCAIRWLRAHAAEHGIDPDRIGVWGSSAGGHLVAMLGTAGDVEAFEGAGGWPDQSSRVQAVCDFYGPSDFLRMSAGKSHMDHDAANSPESQLIGGAIQENKAKARAADPATYASKDDPPFIIFHGEKDTTVPINQSEWLTEVLVKKGVDVTFVRVKRGGHGFRGDTDSSAAQIQEQVAAFFDKHLAAPPPGR